MKKLKYTNIPSESPYGKYREYLRVVSEYSCTYCTITESESSGATFNIDHFRPQKYFPSLKDVCTNLRYACPRCNSYKKDNWISKTAGCIKDCFACNNKVCISDVHRFIDCLNEEPDKLIELNGKGELVPINGSKPAEYTIRYLRLNRAQLIKLRNVRRFIELWRQELLDMIKQAQNQIEDFEKQQKDFDLDSEINMSNNDLSKMKYFKKIASIQFDMLLLQARHFKDFLEAELGRLDYLSEKHTGADNTNIN